MNAISTISEFLLQAGTEYQVIDMGRGLYPIDAQTFLEWENTQTAIARPRLQQGWFGLIFYNKKLSDQKYIWFLKLPVDEVAKLIPAARMSFLQTVVDVLGTQLEHAQAKNAELPKNAYVFEPMSQQAADFNSRCKVLLDMPLSQHYAQTLAYLHQPEQHDWQQIALQGVADLASQQHVFSVQADLINHFAKLHPQVQSALLKSLENYPISATLTQALLDWASTLDKNDKLHIDLLRALSQSQHEQSIFQYIDNWLAEKTDLTVEHLLVMSGRHWLRVSDDALITQYLSRCAEHELFVPIFSDLVVIPTIREQMLKQLRRTDNSPIVQASIGQLFKN